MHKEFDEDRFSLGSEQDVNFQKGNNDDGIFETQGNERESLKYGDAPSRGESISLMKALSVVQEPNPVRKEFLQKGYMFKQSPTLIKVWQKRYFVLDKKTLRYFKNE